MVQVAVIGGGKCPSPVWDMAAAVGGELARRGAVVICGGLGGVMEAVSRGAREAGGTVVGVLPDYNHTSGNAWLTVAIPTGLGHARNVVVVAAGHAVIALPGEHGTASEIHLAQVLGRPVVALGAWQEIQGVTHASDPFSAVQLALELASQGAR